MSETVFTSLGGSFATARRGGIDATEIEFIREKSRRNVSASSISKMIGRRVDVIRPWMVEPEPIVVEPAPEPEPEPIPPYFLSLWRGLITNPALVPEDRVASIQNAVAAYYGISRQDILSDRRSRAVARPRQIAMWLSKRLTRRSLPDIGQRFGGRDHTTVIHAVRRVDELMAEDSVIAREVNELLASLGGLSS